MLATVAFKLLRKSECVPQFYVRRTFFTHVHGCKSSHLKLLDLQRLQSWLHVNTIMTVHVNTIMQAAPSQRRIILISEASNQLLCFNPRNFSLSESDGGLTFFLKSCSWSKKLQPGGKPNSFGFRNPGRPRRSINCSQDGSRTASRVAIQVDRDNCSQLGSRPSPHEQALPTPRRRQEKQRPDEKKISISRLPQGTVRDLILLTMWVLSPTIVVVIFVQCIDCSGWAFSVTDGMLPTDFSLFISFTTGHERIFILSWQYFQMLSPTAC